MNTFNKEQWMKDISGGDTVRTLVLIAKASQQQARNGAFWRLDVKDSSGTREARIWAPHSQKYTDIAAGSIAWLEGRAEVFRDQVQINVSLLQILNEEELAKVDISALLPSSARQPQDMFDELVALCEEVLQHEPLRRFALSVLHEPSWHSRLLKAPAAKEVHHAWVGGFLEHTLSVVQLCMRFCDQYPHLDRQILLVGAMFHDLGKLWELSDELAAGYTTNGRLIGHISLGVAKLDPFFRESELDPALILHIQHLILSHHGFREFGSPVLPQTAEAFALHYADNLDAKIMQIHHLFDNPPKEIGCDEIGDGDALGVWSPYQKLLERSIYQARHVPTLSAKQAPTIPAKQATSQAISKETISDEIISDETFLPDSMPEADFLPHDEIPCQLSLDELAEAFSPPWDETSLPPWETEEIPPNTPNALHDLAVASIDTNDTADTDASNDSVKASQCSLL